MGPVIERVPPGLLVSFRTLRPEVILIRVDLSSRQEGRQKRMGLSLADSRMPSEPRFSPPTTYNFTTWKFKPARWHFIFYGSDGSHETKDGGTPPAAISRATDRSALKPKSSIKIDCISGSRERIERERGDATEAEFKFQTHHSSSFFHYIKRFSKCCVRNLFLLVLDCGRRGHRTVSLAVVRFRPAPCDCPWGGTFH